MSFSSFGSFGISGLKNAWNRAKQGFTGTPAEPDLDWFRERIPVPVFWLFGKTQSGKTSIVRYLTGAEEAAIGNGFRPCTKTSQEYPFPNDDLPVMRFLDTRGLGEPGYDPTEDVAAFGEKAHLLLVTCRIQDFAHGNMREALRAVRRQQPSRPVVLALTCLHELLLPAAHPQPYPFDPLGSAVGEPPVMADTVPTEVREALLGQAREFQGLFDRIVPVDLTKPEEGFPEPNYGGDALKQAILSLLPKAYQESMLQTAELAAQLRESHLRKAMPIILVHSSMAASAGALPIPFVDLLMIPGVQMRMVHELGKAYGQPMTSARFLELATSLGVGLLARQAIRQAVKFIPFVGSAAGAALAWSSTYALGRAYCEYLQLIHDGHIPKADTIRNLYQDHLAKAQQVWAASHPESEAEPRK